MVLQIEDGSPIANVPSYDISPTEIPRLGAHLRIAYEDDLPGSCKLPMLRLYHENSKSLICRGARVRAWNIKR